MATCASGRGRPASTSSMRNRVSIGDSADASACSRTRRSVRTPGLGAAATAIRSCMSTSPAWSAMSAMATASVNDRRMQRSRMVRGIEVAGRPRLVTRSSRSIARRRTTRPARVDMRAGDGTVTSIGLDWVAWLDIEPVKPSRGEARKDGARRESTPRRLQLELGRFIETRQRVGLWPEASPGSALQVPPVEPMTSRIRQSERPTRQSPRNHWSSPHESSIDRQPGAHNGAC